MSKISYFQKYGQRENHATNNTMLMLQHVYRLGPHRLGRVLASLLDDPDKLLIGPTFEQQVRGIGSVPDAAILQQPFELWIETKLGDDLDDDQISRHLAHVGDAGRAEGLRVLVGLTRHPLTTDRMAHFKALGRARNVAFVGCTFEDVVDAIRAELHPHEPEQLAILEDYETFLDREGLLLTDARRIAIFPCGVSINENIRFRLYYEPPSRPRKRSVVIGLYANKAVQEIGRVEAVITCDWIDGQPRFIAEVGEDTPLRRARIIEVVEETTYYDLRKDAVRFYLLSDSAKATIRKVSPGGIMGLRYLDLDDTTLSMVTSGCTMTALATHLAAATFE